MVEFKRGVQGAGRLQFVAHLLLLIRIAEEQNRDSASEREVISENASKPLHAFLSLTR